MNGGFIPPPPRPWANAQGIEYQLHKVVKLKHMQTVTGRADRLSITVHYVLSIPRTRISVPTSTTFVCNTRDTYNRVIYLIHQQVLTAPTLFSIH